MLKAMGHVGAMAKLEEELEEDTLDLASGVGGKELTAKARALAVSRAAESLEAAIRSSPIATAKLHNTYSFDRKANGDYGPAHRFGFKHKDAILARHRDELNLQDVKDFPVLTYCAASDTVCASLDAAWVPAGGHRCAHTGARVHAMTTSKAYHHSKPANVDDLQGRFHALYGRVQHDILFHNLDREYAIIMEGPGGDALNVQSVRLEVLPDPDWQRDWLFLYDVLDQVKINLCFLDL